MDSAAPAAVTDDCGQDAGLAVIEEHPELDPFPPPFAVGQVLCGEFLGPGSEAMVVPILPSTCGVYFGWAAFRRLGDDSWQLAWKYDNGQTNLVAVGTDLEETVSILGSHDPRCTDAQKSTKTRSWHWDGQKFVASSWTVHLEQGLEAFLAAGPGFGIPCLIGDEPGGGLRGASCKSGKLKGRRIYTQLAEIRGDGKRLRTCQKFGVRACGGAPCGCYEDLIEVGLGERVVAGRFSCSVRRHGVACTASTGAGFFINENKIRRLGPGPTPQDRRERRNAR